MDTNDKGQMTNNLTTILQQLQRGEYSLQDAEAAINAFRATPASAVTDTAHIDVDRRSRCGFPEVVYCEGKTPEAVLEIFQVLHRHGEAFFGTRTSPEQADAVLRQFPDAVYNPTARTIRLPTGQTATEQTATGQTATGQIVAEQTAAGQTSPEHAETSETPTNEPASVSGERGRVAVITAGTSDRPVAEEAVETLRWMGCGVELIVDVGVAGPHRLGEHLARFTGMDAVVVVAGMEGALPSVVGGWVDCPVFAVPTSVGYGASFQGVAALLGMLNSCAANVAVVNIDAGFKAAYLAGLVARKAM